MRGRITKRSVDSLKPRQGPQGARPERLWDTDVTGFGCLVTKSGHKSYVFQYRTRQQASRTPKRLTIGAHGELTPDEARTIARDLLLKVRSGEDPGLEWRRVKGETFGDLADHFMHTYLHKKKRPPRASTRRDYEVLLRVHLLPRFGKRRASEITTQDLDDFHQRLRGTPYQANRALGLAHQLFKHAERLGWRPQATNPTLGVDRYPEQRRGAKKNVMLTAEQMAQLHHAIQAEKDRSTQGENPAQQARNHNACAAIELAFWTGWRISEILQLQWHNLNLETGTARLEKTKTAAEEHRSIPEEAIRILTTLDRHHETPWVFPGRNPSTPLTTVRRHWYRIRQRAQLDNLDGLGPLRLHDLRHNAVSWDVSRGTPLEIAGKNVGHRSRQATEIYAHFAPTSLKREADARAQAMRDALETKAEPPVSAEKGGNGRKTLGG